MRRSARWLSIPLALGAASCQQPRDRGVLAVSVVGDGFHERDPDRAPLAPADAWLAAETASGLVRIDGTGQVEPALAESWITTADGLSTVFRIRRTTWPSGREVTGEDVAASLQRALASNSRNRLRPFLTAVDSVIGMTDRVVEVRLKVPRPNLLQLLAQPDLGIRRGGVGVGPYRVVRRSAGAVRLEATASEDTDASLPEPVILRSERTAVAVARFTSGDARLVAGGTLADLPIATVANLRPGRLRFDPVQGLFGLAFRGRTPFVNDAGVRQAMAAAVNRPALAAAVGLPGWTTTQAVLPAALDSASGPAAPPWAAVGQSQRNRDAAARIAAWRAGNGDPPILNLALPSGYGMRALFARLASDWRAIGVSVRLVAIESPIADLRLIDAVAPNASANWYLTSLSCAAGYVCDASGDAALLASRDAPDLQRRSALLGEADAVLARRGTFIALGVPVRWSLVDPALTGWRENTFAIHPLAELRTTPL